MSKFTKEMVDDLANKLLIGLSPEENAMVLAEFEVIDETIDLINRLEGIEDIEPMTHALDDFYGVMAEDISEDSMTIEEALKNSGGVDGREIEIPKVVEE